MSAIVTTFPLSNFKTKHIFGIHMERVKFLKSFGASKGSAAPPEGEGNPAEGGNFASSQYVLSFEIGQRESGFYSERTESQNHKAIQ